ncbi:MAG: ABC-2 transporter permease [Defluviitaleaceae bacterium]|nr:ABC-2 transporter permease [Defluviitaleaceae bacterium]
MTNSRDLIKFIHSDFLAVMPKLFFKGGIFAFVMIVSIFGYYFGGVLGVSMGIINIGAALPNIAFEAGEGKNGLDRLYAMLCIERKTVVLGRYTFFVLLSLISSIIYFLFATIMQKLFNYDVSTIEITIITFVCFFASTTINILHFPLSFKFGGYKLKRYTSAVPSLLVLFIMLFIRSIDDSSPTPIYRFVNFLEYTNNQNTLFINILLPDLIFITFWLISLILSFLLSLKIYNNKDF